MGNIRLGEIHRRGILPRPGESIRDYRQRGEEYLPKYFSAQDVIQDKFRETHEAGDYSAGNHQPVSNWLDKFGVDPEWLVIVECGLN